MKALINVIFFMALILLQSCAKPISPEKIASADHGSPPSIDYEALIKDKFYKTLIDPTSPLYEFSTPTKGYTKENSLVGTNERFGWKICGRVNSKNRLGAYAGWVPFFVLINNDVIVEFILGENNSKNSGMFDINHAIAKACAR